MKIIKNSIKEIKRLEPGKKIEYCGRVCYKSDSKINDESYIKFIQNIVRSNHCSVLEHERIAFKIDSSYDHDLGLVNEKYFTKSYLGSSIYISANVRAWYQNCKTISPFYIFLKEKYPFVFTEEAGLDKIKLISLVEEKDLPKEIKNYHDSKTFEIICSRACSHQLVRHRSFSFSQQSQRYCNFSIDKFGHSIDFIMPVIDDKKDFSETLKERIYSNFETMFQQAENNYFSLIDDGCKPEDARAVLPNAAATTIVMTGTTSDWEGFFTLRCDEHAQREIRDIANMIKKELYK